MGVLVVGAATVAEVKDVCDTLEEIEGLSEKFEPTDPESVERHENCTVDVLTPKEILLSVTTTPGAAGQSVKEATPSLQEIKDIDWAAYDASLTTSLSSAGSLDGRGPHRLLGRHQNGLPRVLDWLISATMVSRDRRLSDGDRAAQRYTWLSPHANSRNRSPKHPFCHRICPFTPITARFRALLLK